jgi:citrate synthase
MNVEEAAKRLGVKPATLYSYVSRGVLTRTRAPDGHSLFNGEEVERLARRGRPRRNGATPELVIESALTALGRDRQYYRGRDATKLADDLELEDVAALLWATGPTDSGGAWRATPEAVEAAVAAQLCLPPEALPLERLQVGLPVLALYDPLRLTFQSSTVPDIGRTMIGGMLDCLPGDVIEGTLAQRLWPKLTGHYPAPHLVDLLRAALVLTADHELASSTHAVRVAASVQADPYGVVATGLGVTSGALHGGASLATEALLIQADNPTHGKDLVRQRLRRGERVPGFGHKVYRSGDHRATNLLARIHAAAPDNPRLAVSDAIVAEAHRRRLPPLNIDFALATLVDVTGMMTGAGETIFAIARTVGWLAHAIEEYTNPMRLRLRAQYVGEPYSEAFGEPVGKSYA